MRILGAEPGPTVLCLAGFGDDTTMFEPLLSTALASTHRLVLVDLPGFGRQPLAPGQRATLVDLAAFVTAVTAREPVDAVLAHSAASIVTGLAAADPRARIGAILSLEGNLTRADTFFTGLAAEHDAPAAFHASFLAQLDALADGDPVLGRYRSRVAMADPSALWTLGREVVAFSERRPPGDLLLHPAPAWYLHNPENVPPPSMAWLAGSALPSFVLPGASHWATVDAPGLVAAAVAELVPARR